MAASTVNIRTYNLKGGWMEIGTVTLTPGVVSQQSELELQVDQNISCNTTDQIFVNVRNQKTGLALKGARITANGVVKVLLANYLTSTNVTDSTSETYDYMVLHLS